MEISSSVQSSEGVRKWKTGLQRLHVVKWNCKWAVYRF
jgi:hypothetical protein